MGDTLIGNALVNTITGSLGNDTLSGLGGNDTLDGRSGSDWVDYSYASSVSVNLATGDGVVSGRDTDKLISIENDKIYGDAAPIMSTSTLVVASDQSVEYIVDNGVTLATIYGGNDILQGGSGDDYINGGSGFDTIDFSSSNAKVYVKLNLQPLS